MNNTPILAASKARTKILQIVYISERGSVLRAGLEMQSSGCEMLPPLCRKLRTQSSSDSAESCFDGHPVENRFSTIEQLNSSKQ
jgi:hypothetical protein